jgi:hypothetical protein
VTTATDPTSEALLGEDVAQVEAWLAGVRSGEIRPPERFNWHGFAEGAAFLSRRSLESPSPDQRWGQIAISIYDRLATESEAIPGIADSFSRSSTLLRVGMIRAFGPLEGDPVLDPAVISGWFFRGVSMGFEEASEKAKNWKSCRIEDIRALKDIKHKLNIIINLSNIDHCVMATELQAWLTLVPDLP